MAKLTAAARNKIPTKDFAGPDRSFPIADASHARDALARVANKSPALKAEVRAKVHAKYPDMGHQSLIGEGKKRKKSPAEKMYGG